MRWSKVKHFMIVAFQIWPCSLHHLVRDTQKTQVTIRENLRSELKCNTINCTWLVKTHTSAAFYFLIFIVFWHFLTGTELHTTSITPGKRHTVPAMKNTYYLFQKWLIPLLEQFLIKLHECYQVKNACKNKILWTGFSTLMIKAWFSFTPDSAFTIFCLFQLRSRTTAACRLAFSAWF